MSLTDYTTDQDKKQEQIAALTSAAALLHQAADILASVDALISFQSDRDEQWKVTANIQLLSDCHVEGELGFCDLFEPERETKQGKYTRMHVDLSGVDVWAYRPWEE